MAVSDQKLRRLRSIARLRRAQRRMPRDRDLAAVRSELEQELGETVSQRIAARFLGVSHTALQRWASRGDLPVVQSLNGRPGIPVPALLDLHETIEQERAGGRRHLLERSFVAGRDRARRLRVQDLAPPANSTMSHSDADRRALAYHQAVGRRLTRAMIEEALHRVWKWREEGKLDPSYAAEWERVLRGPIRSVRRAITEDNPRGRDLRQNSPFAGMLRRPCRSMENY